MIVDASALLAIVFAEPEAPAFTAAVGSTDQAMMSVVNYLEASIRVDRDSDASFSRAFDALVEFSEIRLVPVSVSQVRLARRAHSEYGRGQHKARLNLGDCFAYALAKETGLPLLFKGDDFAHTDIEPAIPPGADI